MNILNQPQSILSQKTCLVYDDGYSTELAIDLSKHFKKVYYYVEWKFETKPKLITEYFIGRNIPEIERIDDIWDVIKDVDMFIFTYLYNGQLQTYLESIGKQVYGARKAERLEIDRSYGKSILKQFNLPVGKYEIVKGTENLRIYLKKHNNVWVKIDGQFRGMVETWHSINYELSELWIDELEGRLGTVGDDFEFLIEDTIEDSVEVGLDLISVNGQYAKKAIVGLEIKNKGFLGRIMDRNDIPKEITIISDTLSPLFNAFNFKGSYSDEIRITKDHLSYMMDFSMRSPVPPGYLRQYMYKNQRKI